MSESDVIPGDAWPGLPLDAWSDTYATLHLWTQIVGKIRLAQTPWTNHSWHVTLSVTPRGLTTSSIPYGTRAFQIDFDFIAHELKIQCDNGPVAGFPLEPQSVAVFYRRLRAEMLKLGLEVKIYPKPNEVSDAIPFDQDEAHASYDPDYANRFWRVLLQSDRIFKIFRARFVGKCSPVHSSGGLPIWPSRDFPAGSLPSHPGGVPNLPDRVAREAYSHEVSSCGFWPGGGAIAYPVYYSYAYPEPQGFAQAPIKPAAGFYNTDLREFILPYDEVRKANSPADTLLDFMQTTYEAAADLAHWDRASLEGLRYL